MKYAFGSMSKGEREVIDGSCQLATNEILEEKKKKVHERRLIASRDSYFACQGRQGDPRGSLPANRGGTSGIDGL